METGLIKKFKTKVVENKESIIESTTLGITFAICPFISSFYQVYLDGKMQTDEYDRAKTLKVLENRFRYKYKGVILVTSVLVSGYFHFFYNHEKEIQVNPNIVEIKIPTTSSKIFPFVFRDNYDESEYKIITNGGSECKFSGRASVRRFLDDKFEVGYPYVSILGLEDSKLFYNGIKVSSPQDYQALIDKVGIQCRNTLVDYLVKYR